MIGIVLTLINTFFFVSTWYFLGRSSIYNKLMKDYRDILRIAIEQEKLLKKAIEICIAKDGMETAKEKEKENGEQD